MLRTIELQLVRRSVHVLLIVLHFVRRFAAFRCAFHPTAAVSPLSFVAVYFDETNAALFNGRSLFHAFPVVCADAWDPALPPSIGISGIYACASRGYVLIHICMQLLDTQTGLQFVANASSSGFDCIIAFEFAFEV